MSNLNQTQVKAIEDLVEQSGGVEELSKESGIPESSIEGMLKNARKMAPVTFVKLSKSFDIAPSKLIGSESDKHLFIYKALYKCNSYKDICRLCGVTTQKVFSWLDGHTEPSDDQVEQIREFVDGVDDVID